MADDFRGRVHMAFKTHDDAINTMHRRFKEVEKGADKVYLQNLTHVMMWDVLIGLLAEKGIITKEQFDKALTDLHDKTKAAMEAEQAKKIPPEGQTTVLSETPAIPVLK